MRQLTKENITADAILAILRILHDANVQLMITKIRCEEASSELESKVLCVQ